MDPLQRLGYASAVIGMLFLWASRRQDDRNPRLVLAWRSFIGLGLLVFLARMILG